MPALTFIPNVGQLPGPVHFGSHGTGFDLGLEADGLTLTKLTPAGSAKVTASGAGSTFGNTEARQISGATKAGIAELQNQVHFSFLDANPLPEIDGLDPTAAKINYIAGNDPAKWKRNIPVFKRVRYRNLYRGVDVVFYGIRDGRIEYDLVLAPGADPEQIRFRVSAAQKAELDAEGNIQLDGRDGAARLDRPVLYQDLPNARKTVTGAFVQTAENEFAFRLGGYDRTRPLVIDPSFTVTYSSYLGGSHDDEATGMAVDRSGDVYVAGFTSSADFPVTSGAFQTMAPSVGDAGPTGFVSKFSPRGELLYSTYLGTLNVVLNAITVDASGDAFVTGISSADTYPTTAGALQSTLPNTPQAYGVVTELSPDGSSVLYSTYYGATAKAVFPEAIVLDQQGKIYIAGFAPDAGLQVSANAYQASPRSSDTGFIAKLDPTQVGQNQLIYGTYLGGSAGYAAPGSSIPDDGIFGLAVDGQGRAYLGGETYSTDFPTTSNAIQAAPATKLYGTSNVINCDVNSGPASSGFVSILSADGSSLVYSSFFGGKTMAPAGQGTSCVQSVRSLQLDPAGNIYLYGVTPTSDIGTQNAYLSTLDPGLGFQRAFLAKLAPGGASLVYSTYLGGASGVESLGGYATASIALAGYDMPAAQNALAVDSSGDAYVTMHYGFPDDIQTTAGALYQPNCYAYEGDCYSLYLGEISPDGSSLLYGTFYGAQSGNAASILGGANDRFAGIALDASNNVYLAGTTGASNFPVTANAAQGMIANGLPGYQGDDVFVSILNANGLEILGPAVGGNTGDVTITLTGADFQAGASCSLTLGGTTIASTSAAVSPDGTALTCTFALNGASVGLYNLTVNNGSGGTLTDNNAFTVQAAVGPQLSVDVTGASTIRINDQNNVFVNYSNTGDTDALDSRIWITLPGNLTYSLASLGQPTPLFGLTQAQQSELDYAFTDSSGNTQIGLLVPRIAAGASGTIVLVVESTAVSTTTQTISASITPNWFTSSDQETEVLGAIAESGGSGATGSAVRSRHHYGTGGGGGSIQNAQLQNCLTSYFTFLQQQITPYIQQIPPFNKFQFNPATFGIGLAGGLTSLTGGPQSFLGVGMASAGLYASLATVGAGTGGALGQLGAFGAEVVGSGAIGGAGTIFATVGAGLLAGETILFFQSTQSVGCQEYFGFRKTSHFGFKSKGNRDPNDLTGPAGTGSPSFYIGSNQPLGYTLSFENEPAATLPVQKAVVTDQLDSTRINLAKSSLGVISFGSTILIPPSGVTSYATTVSLSSSLSVQVNAAINTSSGLITWTFQSIDPATGQPPTDVTVGFLPPDADGIEGQASVTFFAMPLSSLTTGAQITDAGSVVFDQNAPLSTPSWLNTLDLDPPTSSVGPLPAQSPPTFNVAWSGTDVGSGIASYNIYVSDNGGGYTVLEDAVTTTSTTFTGTAGHSYSFYSIATDAAGNVEASKSTADATTSVSSLQSTMTVLTASAASAVVGANVTFTAVVTSSSGSGVPTGTVAFDNGSTQLGTGTLNSSGTATFSISSLAAGVYSVTAAYGGDSGNAPSTSSAVTLTITAAPADFSISLSPTSGAVSGSGSITSGITITPANGFNQQVSLTCSGAPADATCTISPNSVTLSGTSPGTANLTIQTGLRTAALARSSSSSSSRGTVVWGLLSGGGLLSFALLRRRRHPTWMRLLALLALSCATIGAVTACGGGSNPSTPSGTYTITVTATSGADSHAAIYSLTVQ